MQELYGKYIKDPYNHRKVGFFCVCDRILKQISNIVFIFFTIILDNQKNNDVAKKTNNNSMLINNNNNLITNQECHQTNSIGSDIDGHYGYKKNNNNNQNINNNHHDDNNHCKNRFHLRRSDQTQIEKSRIRTLRMTIIIVMAFVWCWTPYASIVLLYHFYKPQVENMPKDLKDALFMFAVSNSCVNPLVYGSYTMNFRQHCCNFLRKLSFWKRKTVNLPQSNHSIFLDDQTSYSGLNTSTPLYQNNYNNNSMMTDHQSLDSSCYSAKFCPTDD